MNQRTELLHAVDAQDSLVEFKFAFFLDSELQRNFYLFVVDVWYRLSTVLRKNTFKLILM